MFKENILHKIYNDTFGGVDPEIEWSPDSEFFKVNSTYPERLPGILKNAIYFDDDYNFDNACNSTKSAYKVIIHPPNELPTRVRIN